MADLLGIECGATQTVALFEQADEVQRAVFGPANLRLLSERQLAAHLRKIAKAIDLPEAVTIGMAGARTTADKKRLLKAAVKVWPKASHIHATNDLETALAADTQRKPLDRVLVISGTGSCCFGQAPDGTIAKLGGWDTSSVTRAAATRSAFGRSRPACFTSTATAPGPRLANAYCDGSSSTPPIN